MRDYTRKLGEGGVAFAAIPDDFTGGASLCQGIVAGYFNNLADGFSYVSILHVRSEFRECHLGRKLMGKAIEYSKVCGLRTIKLQVNKTNTNAIGFYRHLGFEVFSETERKLEMQLKIQ